MRIKSCTLNLLNIENENIKSTLGGNPAVLLTERACGSISRIFERLFVIDKLAVNNSFKTLFRHIDLASDLNKRNGNIEFERNVMDYTQIARNILADISVTTG